MCKHPETSRFRKVFDCRDNGRETFKVHNCLDCGSFRVVVYANKRAISETNWVKMRESRGEEGGA